jgi:TonB family protein
MNAPLMENAWLAFSVACVAKVTVVWGVAAIVVACLRRAPAASRHFVWAAAVLASIALPLLTLVLPAWRSATVARAAAILAPAGSAVAAQPSEFVAPMRIDAATSTFHIVELLIVLWAIGVIAFGIRLLAGLIRIQVSSEQAFPLADSAWQEDLAQISKSLQIGRQVRLLESASPAAMPLTWGLSRPTILLPSGTSDWSKERRRIVLCHELAHISRGDWILQICAEISRAIYWFHPLAWQAAAKLRHESERACDDVVLNSGIAAEDYAGELLDLARKFTNAPARICPALAIARTTNLERRFAAMLNPSLNRRSSRRSRLLIGLATICLLLPLAAVRLPAQNVAGNFTGTIYDASGAVVPNATVIVTDANNKSIEMSSSAADGQFGFKSLPAGEYTVKVMKPGFEVYRDPDVTLKVGESRTLDVHLKVGTLSDSVEVQAAGHGQSGSAAPAKRVKLGGEIEASKIITKVQPIYPEAAKAAGVKGTVNLHAIIGMDGVPLSLQVVNTDVNPDLARASIEAVSKWRYSPTLLNGQPIEVDTNITVLFTLNR